MKHLRNKSWFAALLLMAQGMPLSAQGAEKCVKFFYLDVLNHGKKSAPLMACEDVVDSKAVKCFKVADVDIERIITAKNQAINQIYAFSQGMAFFGSCYLSTVAVAPIPLIGPAVSDWVARDNLWTTREAEDAAMKNSKEGIRTPGDYPSRARGEIRDSKLVKKCREAATFFNNDSRLKDPLAKAALSAGVDAAVHYFYSADFQRSAIRGDIRALKAMYGDNPAVLEEERKKLAVRTQQLIDRQSQILNATVVYSEFLYKYIMDETKFPVGLSPYGVSNELKCIAPKTYNKAREIACRLSRAIAELESYEAGDIFKNSTPKGPLVPPGTDEKVAEAIENTCDSEVKTSKGVENIEDAHKFPLASNYDDSL